MLMAGRCLTSTGTGGRRERVEIMGVGVEVAIVVGTLAIWVAGLYRYEKGMARKDRRANVRSRETLASGDHAALPGS
jgi:hypothetical protein